MQKQNYFNENTQKKNSFPGGKKRKRRGSSLNVILLNMNILLNFIFAFFPQMCLMLNVYLNISMSQTVTENILFLMKIQYNKWLTSCSCFEISLVLNCFFFFKVWSCHKKKIKILIELKFAFMQQRKRLLTWINEYGCYLASLSQEWWVIQCELKHSCLLVKLTA